MKNLFQILAGTALGVSLIIGLQKFGGVQTFGVEVPTLDEQKNELVKQYIYAQARLNEIPTLDLSIMTIEEMTQAAADIIAEKGTPTKENLFEALHDTAVSEGTACR